MIRLRIGRIICSEDVIDKLEWKHNVRQFEVEEVLRGKPQVLFVENVKGMAKMFILAKEQRKLVGIYQ